MIVVDSSVWIANLRNELSPAVRWLRAEPRDEMIAVGDVILMEVLRGARSDEHALEIQNQFGSFAKIAMLTPGRAVLAARHYRLLRSLAVTTRSAMDLVIATCCIDEGHQLMHQDRDFDPFERYLGLQVFRPH